MDAAFMVDFLGATVRIATPILMAAMGGILIERSGTFAVGLEGMMLSGAFCGVVGAFLAGSIVGGLLAACLGGLLFGLIVAVATTKFDTEHMVTGLAANLLALGLTSFVLRTVVGGGKAPVIHIPLLQPVAVPVLGDLPVVGALLFRQPPLTYLAFAGVIAISIFLRRTRGGLLLTASGENPLAVFAAGTDPIRVRFAALLAGGAIAGLAGAVLSLQQIGTFTDGMTGGRGYMALAAVIVGRWLPLGTLAGCLMFGATEAMQLRAQAFNLPVSSYVIQMVPYLAALLVLAGLGRTARLPSAIGQPFRRD
jgi:general nucleoside transport system permease protein